MTVDTPKLVKHCGFYGISSYLEELIPSFDDSLAWPLSLKLGENLVREDPEKRFRIELFHGNFTDQEEPEDRILLRSVWFLRKPYDDPFDLEWAFETPQSISQKLDAAYSGGRTVDLERRNFVVHYELEDFLILIVTFDEDFNGIREVKLQRMGLHKMNGN